MIIDKIVELRRLQEKKEALLSIEKEAIKPIEYTKDDLLLIYNIIKECLDCELTLNNFEVKHYFIAIVSFIYSPRVWMGKKLEVGLRSSIAEVLGYEPCTITNNLKDVSNWLNIYKDFRLNVGYIYGKVILNLNSDDRHKDA